MRFGCLFDTRHLGFLTLFSSASQCGCGSLIPFNFIPFHSPFPCKEQETACFRATVYMLLTLRYHNHNRRGRRVAEQSKAKHKHKCPSNRQFPVGCFANKQEIYPQLNSITAFVIVHLEWRITGKTIGMSLIESKDKGNICHVSNAIYCYYFSDWKMF